MKRFLYAMGKVFVANPRAIESGVDKFPDAQRKLIAHSVQTGWINIKAGLSPAIVQDRDERIKCLFSEVVRAK
jgi:hypothetical protein